MGTMWGLQSGGVVQGTSYGAPCALENILAKVVIDRVPSIEMVRFVNSGTEACLSVLRLMRAFTGRDKVSVSIDFLWYAQGQTQ